MTRDEILEKSKKVNAIIDEGSAYIGLKATSFSMIIAIILGSFLARVDIAYGR